MKKQRKAFTLIELLVVISIIALLIAILLPALGAARKQAVIMQSTTQQRGLHQAFVIYGQDNAGWYPGLVKGTNGNAVDILPASINGDQTNAANQPGTWPSARFALTVVGNYVSPEYVISPAEPAPRDPWVYGKTGTDSYGTEFDWHNFSYALDEWFVVNSHDNSYKQKSGNVDDLGSDTPVLTDRLVTILGGFGDINSYVGIYTSKPGKFQMGIAWNDGHTTFVDTPVLDTVTYGKYTSRNDNIYIRDNVDPTWTVSPAPNPSKLRVGAKVAYRNTSSHQSDPSEVP